jgi:hypothetical protein
VEILTTKIFRRRDPEYPAADRGVDVVFAIRFA